MDTDARRRTPGGSLPGGSLLLPCALALLSAAGCMAPESRINQLASHANLSRDVVNGTLFRHVLYRTGRPLTSDRSLHVYIEGDGSPYQDRFRVAADPTPRQPVMLELMSRDTTAAVYLGRPCYFGLARDQGCDSRYWTARRFSPEVLASLAEVLHREIAHAGAEHVTLLGHSGGATLAMLLAEQVPQVDRVITLAGNLDPSAWTRLHGYAPLMGSLDPMAQTAMREDLLVIHYAGESDRNIPPALIEAAAQRLGGSVIVVPKFTHTCCWTRISSEVLSVAN